MKKELRLLLQIYITVLIIYTFNIVMISIKGSSLFNNISAWVCAGMWAVASLFQALKREKSLMFYRKYADFLEINISMLLDENIRLTNKLRYKNKTNSEEE